ncbi:hypothetical protein [Bradyrhizobium sp. Bra64]|uniref:hypothetical protein n=1 Tax=Bradyrhizobium sp. Bra64 TaxID=2926009 RepID=UPI002118CB01|nr:hypothetical protein [Bradyrhizobium sp. Bra64]
MKAAILKEFGTPLEITAQEPVQGTGEVIVDVIVAPVFSYTGEVFEKAVMGRPEGFAGNDAVKTRDGGVVVQNHAVWVTFAMKFRRVVALESRTRPLALQGRARLPCRPARIEMRWKMVNRTRQSVF